MRGDAEGSSVDDLVASSFPLVSDAAAVATTRVRDRPTHQLRKPTRMSSLHGHGLRQIEPDVSPQPDDDKLPAGVAPPQGEQSRSGCEGFDTGWSPDVDCVLSLFKNKSGFEQLLSLEPDQVRNYADILDAVRYSIKLVLRLI